MQNEYRDEEYSENHEEVNTQFVAENTVKSDQHEFSEHKLIIITNSSDKRLILSKKNISIVMQSDITKNHQSEYSF